jgi:hypothetical protein
MRRDVARNVSIRPSNLVLTDSGSLDLTTFSPRLGLEQLSAIRGFEPQTAGQSAQQEDSMRSRIIMTALVIAVLAGTAGYAAAQDYRYDRDGDRYYDRDDNRYYDRDDRFRSGFHVAREFGFRDGSAVAREDMWRGKPFNPNPRGRYDDADHGYRREFGNKHEYREHYSEAYRAGYQNTFRGRGYYR